MNIARETLYAAVFAKFAGLSFSSGGSTAFGTYSRRLQHWDDVASENCPALFQVQGSEVAEQVRGIPTKWRAQIYLYLYVKTNATMDGDAVPSQLLNPILDAIDNALRPDDLKAGTCTLGGLVSHCWINGAIETSEGNLGDTEVAIIPVEFYVPL